MLRWFADRWATKPGSIQSLPAALWVRRNANVRMARLCDGQTVVSFAIPSCLTWSAEPFKVRWHKQCYAMVVRAVVSAPPSWTDVADGLRNCAVCRGISVSGCSGGSFVWVCCIVTSLLSASYSKRCAWMTCKKKGWQWKHWIWFIQTQLAFSHDAVNGVRWQSAMCCWFTVQGSLIRRLVLVRKN